MSLTSSRSAAVALTSAALVGVSALAVPGTSGADPTSCGPSEVATYSVTGGSIEWGVKQTFRNYFKGSFAHGVWTPSEGVSFEGSEKGSDGRFIWPVTSGEISAANAVTARGEGSVNFNAHGGVLDTTIANPTVEINGTAGVLKIDYTGKAKNTDPNAEPQPVGGVQVPAATFTLPQAGNFHTATVTVTAPTAAHTKEFEPAFGYEEGEAVDPITLNLEITSSCVVAPGNGDDDDDQGTTPGGDDQGATPDGIFGSLGTLFGSLGA